MQDQPKYIPLRPTDFFDDHRSARPLPENTVARGHLNCRHRVLYRESGRPVRGPLSLPRHARRAGARPAALQHLLRAVPRPAGQRRRHDCAPRLPPAALLSHRPAAPGCPDGYMYDVITNGFGAMPDYAAQMPPRDRWAIVAYVRALQYQPRGYAEPMCRPTSATELIRGRQRNERPRCGLFAPGGSERRRSAAGGSAFSSSAGGAADRAGDRRLLQSGTVPALLPLGVHVLHRRARWDRMALDMLQFLTGGAWGIVIRRICEAATRTLPLLAVLFLPIVVRHSALCTNGRTRIVANADEVMRHKHVYLNVPVLPDSRGALLRGLDLVRVPAQQMVARSRTRPAAKRSTAGCN